MWSENDKQINIKIGHVFLPVTGEVMMEEEKDNEVWCLVI